VRLIQALLENIFDEEQCGGKTMSVTISMSSPTHCSSIRKYSTCGGDETRINFIPELPLSEALLHSAKYIRKGTFEHK
jgi:hypothetical protein